MIARMWTRHLGVAAASFGTIGALIYVLMIAVTLAHIENVSGQVPFDMRPLGYSPTDAAALLEELGVQGRRYYLSHQIPLDTAYPALLALTLVSSMRWFGQSMPPLRLIRVGVFLALGSALCDYGENLGIVAMILHWPDLSTALVYTSSIATVAKSILTTAAILFAILIGFLSVKHSFRASIKAQIGMES